MLPVLTMWNHVWTWSEFLPSQIVPESFIALILHFSGPFFPHLNCVILRFCKCTTVLHPPRNITCGKTSTLNLPSAVFFCGVGSSRRKLCLSTNMKYSFSHILYLRVGKNTHWPAGSWSSNIKTQWGEKKQEAVIKGYIFHITIMILTLYIHNSLL